jgi:metal-dependent amidase/aminoacylase/carboxypeptidase family protein
LDVTFHGVGGHGSAPQFCKDPVLMAAASNINSLSAGQSTRNMRLC